MIILLTIIWLLLGVISVWREYHGTLKTWYIQFNESYWDFHKKKGSSAIMMLLIFSPILVLGGLITALLFELTSKTCWWFTTKNK